MFSPDAIARAAAQLAPRDFFVDGHGVIYAAMLRVHGAGRKVDAITVQQALADAEELDLIGGRAQLALLMEEASIAAHLEEYIGIVAELSQKRDILRHASQLAAGASNGT